jgi:S1-C subfamily serine protease
LADYNFIQDGIEYGEIKKQLKALHPKKSKFIFFKPQFYIPLAAAAVIALIFTIGPLENNNNTASAEDSSKYQELSTEEEASETSFAVESELDDNQAQDSTDSFVDELSNVLELEYKEPKGTAFCISEEGYFITAKHLVHKRRYVKLQQMDLGLVFNTEVIYRDSVLDFALLRCSAENAAQLKQIPYKINKTGYNLGDDVFTLGYPKADIVYTKGAISSANGFRSDTMTFEVSMASNPGNSGAPLFSTRGELIGMIIANNSKKQSVTYVLKPELIENRLKALASEHDFKINSVSTLKNSGNTELIKKLRPFVFEVH